MTLESKHIGYVGRAVTLKLHVIERKKVGWCCIYVLGVANGNSVRFLGSSPSLLGVKNGDDIEITATVKKRINFRQVPTTDLNYVKRTDHAE